MTKITIGGSKGRMGTRITELAKADDAFEIASQFDIGEDAAVAIEAGDCLIEFTSPQATIEHLEICEKLKKPVVIGTTGLSDEEKARIKEASRNIPIVFSPNMSVGVNLLFKMIADAAKVLDDEYEINIVEAHHINKKDAPSGTAKEMARIVKEKKPDIDIPIESVRESDIVGEHTITFDGPLDTLEITHSAKNRDILAKGALTAAKFVVKKERGLFSMRDVLGL